MIWRHQNISFQLPGTLSVGWSTAKLGANVPRATLWISPPGRRGKRCGEGWWNQGPAIKVSFRHPCSISIHVLQNNSQNTATATWQHKKTNNIYIYTTKGRVTITKVARLLPRRFLWDFRIVASRPSAEQDISPAVEGPAYSDNRQLNHFEMVGLICCFYWFSWRSGIRLQKGGGQWWFVV